MGRYSGGPCPRRDRGRLALTDMIRYMKDDRDVISAGLSALYAPLDLPALMCEVVVSRVQTRKGEASRWRFQVFVVHQKQINPCGLDQKQTEAVSEHLIISVTPEKGFHVTGAEWIINFPRNYSIIRTLLHSAIAENTGWDTIKMTIMNSESVQRKTGSHTHDLDLHIKCYGGITMGRSTKVNMCPLSVSYSREGELQCCFKKSTKQLEMEERLKRRNEEAMSSTAPKRSKCLGLPVSEVEKIRELEKENMDLKKQIKAQADSMGIELSPTFYENFYEHSDLGR